MLSLGQIISETGVETDPSKTRCIENWAMPKTVNEVRAFIGLCSYNRCFVYRFAEIAKPLHKLTEKNKLFIRKEECYMSFQTLKKKFQTLKKKFVEAPVLIHPDFTQSFKFDVDAIDLSIGAVLSHDT